MKKIIHKWIWAWDFDKEEQWLNEMAAKGLALHSVGFCRYEFTPCQPGEYNIRLELLENMPNHPESQQYIAFMEESGIEQIGSYYRWIYFRKKNDGIAFDLFSDYDSRIKHLNRILLFIGIPFGINIYNAFFQFYFAVSGAGIAAVNASTGAFVSLLNLLLGYGFFKILIKKRILLKERQIFE